MLGKNLVPLDKIIYFDNNHFLREKTSDKKQLSEHITYLKNLLGTEMAEEDEYVIRGMLGNLHRIMNETKEAIDQLTICLQYARARRDNTKEVVTLIRLGEALKYDENHKDALHKFDLALSHIERGQIANYRDFALQHKGKCLLELSRFAEAKQCLMQALHIRQQAGNEKLIKSTQIAIDLVDSLRSVKDD